jgi:hypothetical protein
MGSNSFVRTRFAAAWRSQRQETATPLSLLTLFPMSTIRPVWPAIVYIALDELGGIARLSAIYAEVERIQNERGVTLSKTFQATVRRTLQDGPFEQAYRGIWHLKDMPAEEAA